MALWGKGAVSSLSVLVTEAEGFRLSVCPQFFGKSHHQVSQLHGDSDRLLMGAHDGLCKSGGEISPPSWRCGTQGRWTSAARMGWMQWLVPVISVLWESEAENSMSSVVRDHGRPCLYKKKKIVVRHSQQAGLLNVGRCHQEITHFKQK